MAKYSLEFKLTVVKFYLSGQGGFKRTARKFDIDYSIIRKWVSFYKQHGIKGLEPRSKRVVYSEKFKKNVVQYINKNYISFREAAAIFNISAINMVTDWYNVYNNDIKNTSRTSQKQNNKPLTQFQMKSTVQNNKETEIDLVKALLFSKAEIAYLKKTQSFYYQPLKTKDKVKIIDDLRNQFPLKCLLAIASMARSTFYYHISKQNTLICPHFHGQLSGHF